MIIGIVAREYTRALAYNPCSGRQTDGQMVKVAKALRENILRPVHSAGEGGLGVNGHG
jgi:hypothetical protein